MKKKKDVKQKSNSCFVLEVIDDFRAFVKLKDNSCCYAYLEWFTGDVNRPNQWMLQEMSWLTSINELKHKTITKKVVSSYDLLRLAEFISEESLKKAKTIQANMAENAKTLVDKAVAGVKK